MDKTFTLDDLAQFARNEKKLLEDLGLRQKEVKPSSRSISNILSYSKAYSNRPSKLVGRFEQLLN